MNMNDLPTKSETKTEKLSKHLSAAVNAIQKEIEKYRKQQGKALDKRDAATKEADELEKLIVALREQQAKLNGDSLN